MATPGTKPASSRNHPHVVHSDMYQQCDWIMNESGDMKRIEAVRGMVGKHTRLITCLARAYHGLEIDAAWTEEGGFKK